MRGNSVKTDWIGFLNEECQQVMKLAGTLDRGLLRRVMTDAISEHYGFPLKTVFKAYVISSRVLEDVAKPVGRSFQREGGRRYLEVVPEGYSREAFELMGGVLVPCDRDLQPGSVVTVAVELSDPGSQDVSPPALVSELKDLRVQVAVEA